MKYAVLTLGCKTNQAESGLIQKGITDSGHSIVALKDSPDVCVINTCTVTAKSDYQSRQLIRRALRAGAEVVVTGCYAESGKEQIRDISAGLKVVGNEGKEDIHRLLDLKPGKGTGVINTSRGGAAVSGSFRSRPFVKIQDGCNYSCTYCAITTARGRSRSLPEREILGQIKALEEEGFAEVVLTGIHIGHYGIDLKNGCRLSDLIEYILKGTERIRVRVGSIESSEIDKKLIELLSDKRVCPHLHIPLQSGDDTVLKLMKRAYNTRGYANKINLLSKSVKNISIGTDIIVGFPGESHQNYMNSENFVKELPVTYLHLFPYSDRPGTVASEMNDKVGSMVRRERSERMRGIDRSKRVKYRESLVGSVLEVIMERRVADGLYTGKSENYVNVFADIPAVQPGSLMKVNILKPFRDGLLGNSI